MKKLTTLAVAALAASAIAVPVQSASASPRPAIYACSAAGNGLGQGSGYFGIRRSAGIQCWQTRMLILSWAGTFRNVDEFSSYAKAPTPAGPNIRFFCHSVLLHAAIANVTCQSRTMTVRFKGNFAGF